MFMHLLVFFVSRLRQNRIELGAEVYVILYFIDVAVENHERIAIEGVISALPFFVKVHYSGIPVTSSKINLKM